ncbi:MAG: DUF4065 domain-containing protein [candidate division SR1 bacterium]|nr:DUF4065 domain-containing protein [candidate division SR1 bacterium]
MMHQKIKALRTAANLSQEELANAMGISRVAVSQIELGERAIKTEELKKVADIFEVDVNDLLGSGISGKEKKISQKDKNYKLKQLILYVSSKLLGKQNFGETLLNKLLYFIDFDYYEWTGSMITDEEYVKLPYGPVPKCMKEVIEDMQNKGQIKVASRQYFGRIQKTIIPLVDSDIDFLDTIDADNHKIDKNYTPYEDLPHPKKIIKETLDKYGSWSADSLSNWSHNDVPYQSTKKIGETISPGLVFYRKQGYIVNPHNLLDDNE